MREPNFNIQPKGYVSHEFIKRGINDFQQALSYVKKLPYGRNNEKSNLLCVFTDLHGTCGTKHALLKQLADENNLEDCRLVIGIFKMSGKNTPSVRKTLEMHKLEYIPEAHNYLRYKGNIIDCTKTNWSAEDFEEDILEEVEIVPGQITAYKVDLHKKFLEKWLKENENIPYNVDQVWRIKEQCIADLGNSV